MLRMEKTRAARASAEVDGRVRLNPRPTNSVGTKGPFAFPSRKILQRHRRGPTWRVHGEVLEAAKGKTPLSFVIYDLRHTFATRAAADGMPLTTLAAILGHSRNSLRCVMKYVHVDAWEASTRRRLRIDRIPGRTHALGTGKILCRIFCGYPSWRGRK